MSLGDAEVQQFLTFLVCDRHVAAKTQAQAVNAMQCSRFSL
ncbi:phage integrase N-terminal SAM-like domain-containing protein [Aeromonas sobria]